MGWLIDTTRESSDLSAELSRQHRAVEDQTERLLRASGFDGVPAELAVALTDGAMLNFVVRHRPAVAATERLPPSSNSSSTHATADP
ncbi:hypothetical protein [Kocuria kalidii]|uniref:hypothetical protein n=1 Tax=Kocuria kalidii TaxID=3376283 RepID=UPI003793B5D7